MLSERAAATLPHAPRPKTQHTDATQTQHTDSHGLLHPLCYTHTQDLETSFCPEIGDATVGSLAVTTSKDSSIDGPGYLSALVTEVKFVDEVRPPGGGCL